jgi:hypothetical protein
MPALSIGIMACPRPSLLNLANHYPKVKIKRVRPDYLPVEEFYTAVPRLAGIIARLGTVYDVQ